MNINLFSIAIKITLTNDLEKNFKLRICKFVLYLKQVAPAYYKCYKYVILVNVQYQSHHKEINCLLKEYKYPNFHKIY